VSAVTPAYFLINYAIGGISGWKIDLKRYGDATDMWVDYVRVYSGTLPAPTITPKGAYLFDQPTTVSLSCPAPSAKIHYTLDGITPTTTSPVADGPVTITAPGIITAIAFAEGVQASRPATA